MKSCSSSVLDSHPHLLSTLIHTIGLTLCRPRLENVRVTSHSREMMIPQPGHGFSAALDTRPRGSLARTTDPLLLRRFLVPFHETRTHQ